MQVLNVHEREIPARTLDVGVLLNSLSSDHDRLWPGTMWPPMLFDRPPWCRRFGGHGPVRYVVEGFSPGQMLKFRFTGPKGFNGYHHFEVLPKGEHSTVLRYTLDMNAHPTVQGRCAITPRSKRNLVQARFFAEMLENAIRRYQDRAIETTQVIEELIALARDLREADRRGEVLGLAEDELAFYDVLEVNDSAVQILGDKMLRHRSGAPSGGS